MSTDLFTLRKRYRAQVHATLSKQIPWTLGRLKAQSRKVHPRGKTYRRLIQLELKAAGALGT